MPRESNPTLRVVRILDFLSSRPEETFGLSDLARILSMNKATCLTILGGLVETGYLLQDPETKTYCLGPSSVALGYAALTRFPALDPAQHVMRDIADELGLTCLVMVKAANHLVILGDHGSRGGIVPATGRPGYRSPLVPPLGTTLMAFAPPTEVEQWIARAVPALSDDEIVLQRRIMASIRARGFAVTRRGVGDSLLDDALSPLVPDPFRTLYQLTTEVTQQVRNAPEPYVLVDLDDDESYPVSTIAAPVFGPAPSPEFSLVLEGFRWNITGAEIRAIGARVVAASTRLSVSLGGKPPRFRPHLDAPADRAASLEPL